MLSPNLYWYTWSYICWIYVLCPFYLRCIDVNDVFDTVMIRAFHFLVPQWYMPMLLILSWSLRRQFRSVFWNYISFEIEITWKFWFLWFSSMQVLRTIRILPDPSREEHVFLTRNMNLPVFYTHWRRPKWFTRAKLKWEKIIFIIIFCIKKKVSI